MKRILAAAAVAIALIVAPALPAQAAGPGDPQRAEIYVAPADNRPEYGMYVSNGYDVPQDVIIIAEGNQNRWITAITVQPHTQVFVDFTFDTTVERATVYAGQDESIGTFREGKRLGTTWLG